jgi:hypothetical protein
LDGDSEKVDFLTVWIPEEKKDEFSEITLYLSIPCQMVCLFHRDFVLGFRSG